MSEQSGERKEARPLLVAAPGVRTPLPKFGGGTPKVRVPSRSDQSTRLGAKVRELTQSFTVHGVVATNALPQTEPELVVVFETIDSRTDLTKAAEKAGLEILMEAEEETEPNEDFPRINKRGELTGNDAPVPSCLHALCATQAQAQHLVTLWNDWIKEGTVKRGFGPFKDLFLHLQDVRPWSPKDRLRMAGIADRLEGLLDDQSIPVEVELWFRGDEEIRTAAERRVSRLVTELGGDRVGAASIPEVGYHGIAADIPVAALRELVSGNFDDVALIRSTDVMYLRATPQTIAPSPAGEADQLPDAISLEPSGEPTVGILDGFPLANHRLLAGRVIVHDPDDLGGDPNYTPDKRFHGTAMASIVVWGDLGESADPLERPVIVRPVLNCDQVSQVESLQGALVPDLMRRAFIDLFGTDGASGAAPSVQIVNVSLGDPAMPFDTIPSAWARTLDWLAEKYGVLIVVSAGNHPSLSVPGLSGSELQSLTKGQRVSAVADAVASDSLNRRLLSPAEALNAITVGALHEDATASFILGNRFDPSDGEPAVSPVSAVGRGFKRSIKPEIAAPGGRQFFHDPLIGGTPVTLKPAPGRRGPGIKVAAYSQAGLGSGTSYTTGTSAAAALVTRRAAQLAEVLRRQAPPAQSMTKAEVSCALKALLVHEVRWPNGLQAGPLEQDRLIGYGRRSLDLVNGCEGHEVSLLFVGQIAAQEQVTLSLPLPDGLQVRGTKRAAATVAWLSPVNWRHRQYRRAKIHFAKPSGLVPLNDLAITNVAYALAGRGTVEQQVYETERASSAGMGGSLDLRIKCEEQAGGLDGRHVAYAAVVSLWVDPELSVDVYNQVRTQVQARARVQANV